MRTRTAMPALAAVGVALGLGFPAEWSPPGVTAQPRERDPAPLPREESVPISPEVAAPRDVALSVYNQDLGVIRDRRRFSIRSGISEIRFSDVAATLDPGSVRLQPIRPRDLDVLWQDFRFDLASADRLLDRYLGRPVEVTMKDDQVRRGTLLSYDPGSIVLREGSDKVTILTRAEVRLVTLAEPDQGLVTRPTLVWRVRSSTSGEQPLEVSYLASAMSWRADYAATLLNDEGSSLDLQAWATVENRSGASYPDAQLKLVAGTIHRVTPPRPPEPVPMMRMEVETAQSAMDLQQRSFADYHVYEVPKRITLGNNEVKQIGLLEASGVRSFRKYTYEPQRDERRVWTTVEFANAGSGLGVPLPEGILRVFQRDEDGSLQLLGEDRVRHTAVNDTVRVAVGAAFDITAERRQTEARQVTSRVFESAFEIRLTNHKKESVEVTVVEHAYGDWEIVESSHPARKRDATTFEFAVRLAQERPVRITYRLRTRSPEPRG